MYAFGVDIKFAIITPEDLNLTDIKFVIFVSGNARIARVFAVFS